MTLLMTHLINNPQPSAPDLFVEHLQTWFNKDQPTPARKKALHRIYQAYQNQLPGLDLSGLALPDLPECLGQLLQLTVLNLSNNRLQQLPPRLVALKALKTLDLSYNNFNLLPEWLEQLKNIALLDISHNPLYRLPDCWFDLSQRPCLAILNSGPSVEQLWDHYWHQREYLVTQVPSIATQQDAARLKSLLTASASDSEQDDCQQFNPLTCYFSKAPAVTRHFDPLEVTQTPTVDTVTASQAGCERLAQLMAAIEDGLNELTHKSTELRKILSTVNLPCVTSRLKL